MTKKNSKIQNKINERTGKIPKCYHLAKSLLWNNGKDRNCKTTMLNCII